MDPTRSETLQEAEGECATLSVSSTQKGANVPSAFPCRADASRRKRNLPICRLFAKSPLTDSNRRPPPYHSDWRNGACDCACPAIFATSSVSSAPPREALNLLDSLEPVPRTCPHGRMGISQRAPHVDRPGGGVDDVLTPRAGRCKNGGSRRGVARPTRPRGELSSHGRIPETRRGSRCS
jgi:hypothetical protein